MGSGFKVQCLDWAKDDDDDSCFLQIKDEAILEDINNFLNSGEIPNLFNFDEKQEISDRMRDIDR